MNHSDDVCLIKFESKFAQYSQKIEIAKDYPKIGDPIYTISSPVAVKSPTIRNHFVGKFSGCLTNDPECLYTIPGTHGSSGSGVLNEDGELIGILTIAINGFNNITGGVKLSAINEILSSNNIR
jgi:S1-C subfamily serine protease